MKKLFPIIIVIALVCLSACASESAPPEGTVARVGEEYIYAETIERV